MKRIHSVALVLCISLMPLSAFARVVPAKDMQLMARSRRTLRQNVRTAAAVQLRHRLASLISLPNVYESTEAGVSIRYPDKWQMRDLMQHEGNLTLVVMFLSNAPNEDLVQQNINLVLEKLSNPDLTLNEFSVEGLAKEAQVLDNYKLGSREWTTLAGQTADRVIFTATSNDLDMTFEQIWFIRSGIANVWTFADATENFAKHVPTFEAMLDTLIIK